MQLAYSPIVVSNFLSPSLIFTYILPYVPKYVYLSLNSHNMVDMTVSADEDMIDEFHNSHCNWQRIMAYRGYVSDKMLSKCRVSYFFPTKTMEIFFGCLAD